ncbi:NAD(P)H-binding protein [Actinomadura vinacea]|uniref:NAD(P)H-binding protein n=1 Tax=Actinomadura vinacea TaxID=115336 RepID=A0ABN3JJE9_9ACTN
MTILVTGATGKVGRNVVAQLLDTGRPVRAISRSPQRAGLPEDVEVLHADFARPESLHTALREVEKVFLFPSATGLRDFTAAASHAEVRHIVLLSSTVPGYDKPNPISEAHLAHERDVQDSGLPWTFVRPGGFMSNDLNWAATIKTQGVVRDPFGDAGVALIDERDIAAVAVTALIDDAHIGRTHEITGPHALTAIERIRILGQAIGRRLRFERQSSAEFTEQVTNEGYPAQYAEAVLEFGAYFDGRSGPVYPAVEHITGRPPHTYADWAAHHAPYFR